MSGNLLRFFLSVAVCLPVSAAAPNVVLEYVAHACFVVVSPAGTRIVIDPYNGNRWLGYSFPDTLEADAVLVTHPHYDHDAAYYFPEAPVFRRPGKFAVADVELTGVAGKHADPYGKEFGQKSTLWVVETGGVRIAHLGDTGPLARDEVEALGRVDVLLLPVDGDEHILKYSEIERIREALRPRITVPMHYRLSELSELPASLGPIEEWVKRNPSALIQPSHRVAVDGEKLAEAGQIWIFQPSPEVRPWPNGLHQAEEERLKARTASGERRLTHLRKAVSLAPAAIRYSYELAQVLASESRSDEAIGILEKALASAPRADREFTILSRTLLAESYVRQGRVEEAATQYRIVLAGSDWLEPRRKARDFFASRR